MIHYRPFLNCDPPAIAEIWRSQPLSTAFIQTMTPAVLDDMVFASPFFDRHGLILAVQDGKPVGFVHAGFGPNAELTGIDHANGATALLLVSPHRDREAIAQELLSRAEQYLRERGATTLYGGATKTLAPFYFGLYGGSQLSGILASDAAGAEVFRTAGYSEATHSRIFRRDLTGFRPPVDRELMQIRRQYQLVKQTDSLPRDWWEACGFAAIDRLDFVLLPKTNGPPVAEARLWDIEPMASSWGVHAMGFVEMVVSPAANECAMATHFISEIFRQLQGCGITLVEFAVPTGDALGIEVCQKLSFEEVDQGVLFTKPAAL
ncbi:MAG: GNAT family N-acetyltransferase [Planctomycetales bacterium]|nr:GNAT family N-acetyltransferase [Planctomycetales bacterium]